MISLFLRSRHHQRIVWKSCKSRSLHSTAPMLHKILCSNQIDPICMEILRNRGNEVDSFEDTISQEELLKISDNYEALVIGSSTQVNKEVLNRASQLKLIGRAGTGVDNIDVVRATQRGILVLNTSGANDISTAELTMSLITALARNLPQACQNLKDGKWNNPMMSTNETIAGLNGKTIGIIGLGRVGRDIALWCRSLGMTVLGYDPIFSKSKARELNILQGSLDELFARSDFISLHVPFHKETRHMINQKYLDQCKDGVRIINCARRGLVDETALKQAVDSGKVGGVAMDLHSQDSPTTTDEVFQQLLQHPNVLCTPYMRGSTFDAQQRVATNIAQFVADALENKNYSGVINAPNVDFIRRSQLLPYLALAEKMGSLQAQLLRGACLKKINVLSQGKKLANPEISEALVTAVLHGLLSYMVEEQVSFSTCRQIADDMGIVVEEQRQNDVSGTHYYDQLTIEFETDQGKKSITGTVSGGKELRLVKLNNFKIDVVPSGTILFIYNIDRPGMLRQVTGILAKNNLNIGSFGLGRENPGGTALSILNLDDTVPNHVLDELEKLSFISNVCAVNLFELPFLFDEAGPTPNHIKQQQLQERNTTKPLYTHEPPRIRPSSSHFGSGPCKKRPGYHLNRLSDVTLGRSHRSKLGKGKLAKAIEDSKRILGMPEDYLLGIVPASDSGAFEMAMWNMLGQRPVDVCYWESFGKGWYTDATQHLKLDQTVGVRAIHAEYGELPDLAQTNPDHDILFTWNGTTSGVCVPNADWIPNDRKGLTFNDATSAAFAMDIAWDKVDVTTWSWQKVLGGEGAHGMLALSPRAVERLMTFDSNRPLPKIFRLMEGGKFQRGIFEGSTINTPSMLCVEDYLDALNWAESIGGLQGLIQRSKDNLAVLEKFVAENTWISFLAKTKAIRSNTSVCLLIDLPPHQVKEMQKLLEKENIAYDIGSYRDAPCGLRIWCGATVDTADLEALCPWIQWAYHEVKAAASFSNHDDNVASNKKE